MSQSIIDLPTPWRASFHGWLARSGYEGIVGRTISLSPLQTEMAATCGHRHRTGRAAQSCADKLLRRVSRERGWKRAER